MIRDNTEKYVHIRMYRYIVVVYFTSIITKISSSKKRGWGMKVNK